MRNLKAFNSILAAAMTLTLLSGCGSTAAPSSSSDTGNADTATAEEASEKSDDEVYDEDMVENADTTSEDFMPKLDTEAAVTINVVGGYDNFPSLDAVALDFAEYYPNVTISYEKIDDYNNVKDMLLTDNPDVDIFMANNTAVKNDSVIMDIAVNLADESIGFDLSALDEGVLASAKSGDELLRLPLYSTCAGLIVNTTLLEENNLSIPENYDEFIKCCDELKALGYTPIYGYDKDGATNMSLGLYSGLVMVEMAHKNSDGSIQNAINAGEEGAEEAYLEPLKRAEDFAKLGYYSEETNSEIEDSYEGAILRFFEGDVPFLSATSETMSGTKKRESKSEHFTAEPFEYTFIATPMGENGSYAYINSSEGLAVNKNAANLEFAEEFLRFYCQVAELNKSADEKGMLSTSSEAESAACFPDLKLDDGEYTAYISDFYLESAPSKTINTILAMVSDDGISAEDALSQYREIYDGFNEQ